MHYLIWLLVAILYSPTFLLLYKSRWETIDYTHAYFILPVSIWLAWRMRGDLAKLTSTPKPHKTMRLNGNLALIIIGLFIFIFGRRQDYAMVSTISLIPLLFGLTGYLYSPAVAKALSFPILYLLLLVPPPLGVLDSITIPMRHGVSIATEAILRLFNYPITRDGLLLSIGGHEVFMGAPCSGFRSLITMISLGLLYVYLNKGDFWKKTILVISIIPLALLGNLLRVLSVCLATFHFGEKIGQKFHDIGGFVVFLIVIAGMLGIDTLLSRLKPSKG